MSGKLTLGYWDIRGMAQPIRCLMEYCGLDWEDKLYSQADGNAPVPYDRSSWLDVKETLGLNFPNLPYLIDEGVDIKLCQSMAILHHVARKRPDLNLLGSDALISARCDEIIYEAADVKSKMTGLMYRCGREGEGLEYIQNQLPVSLARFEAQLAKFDTVWFAGSSTLTIADFIMHELIDVSVLFSGDASFLEKNNFARLAAFKQAFEALPAIQQYYASPKYAALTGINNKHAKFR